MTGVDRAYDLGTGPATGWTGSMTGRVDRVYGQGLQHGWIGPMAGSVMGCGRRDSRAMHR